MQLRNKLLFYFVSLIILTLLTFGLSSYQIARQSTVNLNNALLENLVSMEAQEITGRLEQNKSSNKVEDLIANDQPNYTRLLLDESWQPVISNVNDLYISAQQLNDLLLELETQTNNSGIYQIDDQSYIWARSALSDNKHTLLLIYKSPKQLEKDFSRLATRLIVVASVILWIAVWVALIMATIVTRRIKEQQNQIEYQASHDVVTGLQNRSFLANMLDKTITQHPASSLSVILIGIDRFSEINDTLGHDFGDLLLKEFSVRLQQEFWENDTIARFGGDQFALLIPLSDASHWAIVTNKIEKILQEPFMIQDIHIITDVSVGVSIYPEHGQTAAQLLKSAEVAMYEAKNSGAFYELYQPDKDPNSVDRLQIISDLSYAIEKREFELFYQPKLDIDSQNLVGCEALLRWNNPSRGMVPPDIFIPLAEQGSIIKSLTEWVLEESVRQCARWHELGIQLSVSVNLSARLLIEDDIRDMIDEALKKYKLKAEYLILEITETAVMFDPVRSRCMMDSLREMGINLSIDDFGTGYTSISQMKNLPVSEIKIDKSFVFNMLKNPGDALLVKLIIDMAHGMGHVVVAEGIEDQDMLIELKKMGCDIAQGYHLGRPMPVASFNDYLAQRKRSQVMPG